MYDLSLALQILSDRSRWRCRVYPHDATGGAGRVRSPSWDCAQHPRFPFTVSAAARSRSRGLGTSISNLIDQHTAASSLRPKLPPAPLR